MTEDAKLNAIGYLGTFFLFLGSYSIANQAISGWVCYIIGDAVWLYVGVKKKMSSLWVCQGVFTIMAFYGLYKWM